MGILKEFKDFAKRGNVIDLAVAVVIGGAFGKIVSSLVNDVVMPPIGLLLGKVDFSNLYLFIGDAEVPEGGFADVAAAKAAGPVIHVGSFIQHSVDFLIVAFVIFMMIKGINRLNRPAPKPAEAPAAPTTKECPHCFTQIPIKATRCPNCTSNLS